ncbi:TerD family protein [Oceaniglobus ichthyenteri]|uniref:TerD family protein n=1 Tax=Oceaniglobus ichthyenteri TaxID=2136177 RepID=UPI000D3642BD|nr:TerD family protein [Oceaniglobus ichthyenteri]
MSVSLAKGQTVSLEKNSGLAKVFMGCGWDPAQPKKKGFFGSLLGGGGADDIDLDAAVIIFDADKQAIDLVWFKQLKSNDGSIVHSGDNLTGDGDGDDEVIHVDLKALDARAKYLVFTVNSFRGQTFDEVDNAFARLVDASNQNEICRYTLNEKGRHTGVVMASMEKTGAGWQMTAHGTPTNGRTAQELIGAAVAEI